MPFEEIVRRVADHVADNPAWWRGWRLVITILVIALAGLFLTFCGTGHVALPPR